MPLAMLPDKSLQHCQDQMIRANIHIDVVPNSKKVLEYCCKCHLWSCLNEQVRIDAKNVKKCCKEYTTLYFLYNY